VDGYLFSAHQLLQPPVTFGRLASGVSDLCIWPANCRMKVPLRFNGSHYISLILREHLKSDAAQAVPRPTIPRNVSSRCGPSRPCPTWPRTTKAGSPLLMGAPPGIRDTPSASACVSGWRRSSAW
jgi:hypothetical protein